MTFDIFRHTLGAFAENTYVAVDQATRQAAIIDPGEGALDVWRGYAEDGAQLDKILLTHAHVDHILGLGELKEATGAPVHMHREDLFILEHFVESARMWGFEVEPAPPPDHFYEHGDQVSVGATTLEVIATPGHSPGGVCLRWKEGVFTGDTLFAGSIGRTDLPGGSFEALDSSIRQRLYVLPDDLTIHPGHMGDSTIGAEKAHNPFVRP